MFQKGPRLPAQTLRIWSWKTKISMQKFSENFDRSLILDLVWYSIENNLFASTLHNYQVTDFNFLLNFLEDKAESQKRVYFFSVSLCFWNEIKKKLFLLLVFMWNVNISIRKLNILNNFKCSEKFLCVEQKGVKIVFCASLYLW